MVASRRSARRRRRGRRRPAPCPGRESHSTRSAMTRQLYVVAAVAGMLSPAFADDAPQDLGAPPRLLIASGIDADSNLHVSGTEQRQKKVTREVEKDGKKMSVEGTYSYSVTVLDRQTVPLKDVTIYDRDGKTISLDQARERLKEPTPILLTFMGEKVDPVYRKIMDKEALTFTFAGIPEFKGVPRADGAKRK